MFFYPCPLLARSKLWLKLKRKLGRIRHAGFMIWHWWVKMKSITWLLCNKSLEMQNHDRKWWGSSSMRQFWANISTNQIYCFFCFLKTQPMTQKTLVKPQKRPLLFWTYNIEKGSYTSRYISFFILSIVKNVFFPKMLKNSLSKLKYCRRVNWEWLFNLSNRTTRCAVNNNVNVKCNILSRNDTTLKHVVVKRLT